MGVAVEQLVYETLMADEELKKFYGDRVFQSYVAPNSLASLTSYILISRISDVTLDRNLDTPGDTLRRVRLQIDVCDVSYGKMAEKCRLVRNVLRLAFPSCIDGSTKGIISSGQTVWNVTSIDIILFEED